ncbi:MAG: hypothetical protein Tsb0013_22350 [Phycisphaerales bacterium]
MTARGVITLCVLGGALALGPIGLAHAQNQDDAVRTLLAAGASPRNPGDAWDCADGQEVLRRIGEARSRAWLGLAIPSVSRVSVLADTQPVLDDALMVLYVAGHAERLIEGWLDGGAGAPGDEAMLDRLAIVYEGELPLLRARACVSAAQALRADDGRAADLLCASALAILRDGDADDGVARVLTGHALRVSGDANGAIRAYRDALGAVDVTDGTWETHLLYGETLAGLALATEDAAEAGDVPERLLATLGASEAHRRDEVRVMLLDARFGLALRRGGDAADASGAHAEAYARAIASGDIRMRRLLRPSMAGIGAILGGARARAEAPATVLLAMYEHDPARTDAPELLLAAYERAEDGWPDEPDVWEDVARTFGRVAIADGMEALYGIEEKGFGGRGLASRGVGALLDVLERRERHSGDALDISMLDGALGIGAMGEEDLRRFERALRDRIRAHAEGPRSDWTAARRAMLGVLATRVDTDDPRRVFDDTRRVVERGDHLLERHDAMLIMTRLLRTRALEDALRADVARGVLALAPAPDDTFEDGVSRGLRPLSHLMAANAALVLGDGAVALTELDAGDAIVGEGAPPCWRSSHRLRAHAHVLLGDLAAATQSLRRALDLGEGPRALPGSVFTPDAARADALTRAFLADLGEPDHRLVIEARYARVRASLAGDSVYAGRTRDAALLVAAGEAEAALGVLDGLERETPVSSIVRAEALLALGDDASAFSALRSVVAALEDAADTRGTRPYWHAWTRMLEILERQNSDGSRTEEIVRTVRRLRALAGWGAHADCTERIDALAERVGG